MTKDLRANRGHANNVVIEMMPNYVTVIAEMTAHEGKEEELKRHLLVLVDQTGAACHTGARTCFDDGLIG